MGVAYSQWLKAREGNSSAAEIRLERRLHELLLYQQRRQDEVKKQATNERQRQKRRALAPEVPTARWCLCLRKSSATSASRCSKPHVRTRRSPSRRTSRERSQRSPWWTCWTRRCAARAISQNRSPPSCSYAGHAQLNLLLVATHYCDLSAGRGEWPMQQLPGGGTGVREARRRRAYVTVHFRATLLVGSRIKSAKNGSHLSCAHVMMSCVYSLSGMTSLACLPRHHLRRCLPVPSRGLGI